MEKELMIPEFAEKWDEERAIKEEIQESLKKSKEREIASIMLLAFSLGVTIMTVAFFGVAAW